MHHCFVLVIQRESKQGKKNGCLQNQLKQPHEVFQGDSSVTRRILALEGAVETA
jgi:hypothetical protein